MLTLSFYLSSFPQDYLLKSGKLYNVIDFFFKINESLIYFLSIFPLLLKHLPNIKYEYIWSMIDIFPLNLQQIILKALHNLVKAWRKDLHVYFTLIRREKSLRFSVSKALESYFFSKSMNSWHTPLFYSPFF